MSECVMIVTGESSGELYGSLLAFSLKKRLQGIRILGIGGERMKAAGVELISGISGAFGITEVISSIAELKKTFRRAVEAIKAEKPAVLVLIDYPDFNLKLASAARENGIKILYYVSPQVWAWRRRRIKKIASLVDRMAVILPFEAELYKESGLQCEFVGHPINDEIAGMKTEKSELKRELGFTAERPLLSLLPGSRSNELERLLPVLLEFVRRFKQKHPEFQFCVPLAPNTNIEDYSSILGDFRVEGALINKGESLKALAASDYAVVASGTASLQAVLLGVPIVVIYKLFPLTYWLGRLIVQVKYISLVNILSDRPVIRELLQSEAEPGKIADEIVKLMHDRPYRESMLRDFRRVAEEFRGKKASERVAEIVCEMAGWCNVPDLQFPL